jgi:hypothetical protein
MTPDRTHAATQAPVGTPAPARTRTRADGRAAGLVQAHGLALELALALGLAAGGVGCGRVSAGEQEPAAARPEAGNGPAHVESAATVEDPLAGTWWVFAKDLPIRAFRMNIANTNDPDGPREGSWVSFDWRATTLEEVLARRSKPVAITARKEGELLVIEGPSPMLTDRGEPNGRRGTWRLEVRRTNMPGEPLRLSGKTVHTELTGPEGVPVDLERNFRPYTRN